MAGRMTAWMTLVKSLRDLNPDPQAGREWGEGRDWCWHGLLKPQSPAQCYTSSSKAIPFSTSFNPSNFFKQFHFLLTKHSNIYSYVGHSYSNSNIFHPPPCLGCSYLWKYSTAFVFLFRFLAHSFLQIYQRQMTLSSKIAKETILLLLCQEVSIDHSAGASLGSE